MSLDERALKQAVELRRAGFTVGAIAEQVGSSIDETRVALEAFFARTLDAQQQRQIELDRFDRMQQVLWPKITRGDVDAIDRALKLSTMRLALVDAPLNSRVLTAFDKTVAALRTADADVAIIELGRSLAMTIDAAHASGDAARIAKASPLTAQMTAVLRELNATPAARDRVEQSARVRASSDDPIATARRAIQENNDLAEFKRRRTRTH